MVYKIAANILFLAKIIENLLFFLSFLNLCYLLPIFSAKLKNIYTCDYLVKKLKLCFSKAKENMCSL